MQGYFKNSPMWQHFLLTVCPSWNGTDILKQWEHHAIAAFQIFGCKMPLLSCGRKREENE